MEDKKQYLLKAIRERTILSSAGQRLISPTGKKNIWLIDMRRILADPEVLDAVAELFWDVYANRYPFQVGGMEVAAIPLLTAILMKSKQRGTPVSGFIIRKERKTYGTGNIVEGALSGLPIIIVDDLVHSATSLNKVRVVLEEEGQSIQDVFVLINYHSQKCKEWCQKFKVSITSLFSLKDLGLDYESSRTEKQPLATFDTVWRFTSPDANYWSRVPKSFPLTDGRRIYFGSDNGTFWALNAQNGEIEWTFKVTTNDAQKNIWSAPAIHNGHIYFGSYDGNVYCLDAETGHEIWRNGESDWVGSSPALAPDLGLLYIGVEYATADQKGGIIALDMATGAKKWEHFTKRYTHASPAYWPEKKWVACGSNDNELFLFNAETGEKLWRFETHANKYIVLDRETFEVHQNKPTVKGSIRHAPAFDKKRNYVVTGCADGWIYIVDVLAGTEVWSVKTGNTIYTVPLVEGDYAYIGSTDKYLYILDLEKLEVVKKIFTGSKLYSPPRLINGFIYFGGCNGIVYELNPKDLEITATHQLKDAITNALTYSDQTGLYYALTYVNELYALRRVPLKK